MKSGTLLSALCIGFLVLQHSLPHYNQGAQIWVCEAGSGGGLKGPKWMLYVCLWGGGDLACCRAVWEEERIIYFTNAVCGISKNQRTRKEWNF